MIKSKTNFYRAIVLFCFLSFVVSDLGANGITRLEPDEKLLPLLQIDEKSVSWQDYLPAVLAVGSLFWIFWPRSSMPRQLAPREPQIEGPEGPGRLRPRRQTLRNFRPMMQT